MSDDFVRTEGDIVKRAEPKFEYRLERNADGTVKVIRRIARRSSEYFAWIALQQRTK